MKKEQIVAMRDNGGMEFPTLAKYVSGLKDFFENPDAVPFACGYKDFGPKEWEVRKMSPLRPADKLTLLNFIDRVEVVAQQFKDWQPEDLRFRHGRIYNGIERMTRDEIGETIVTTGFGLQGLDYNLLLNWQIDHSGQEDIGGYAAKHEIWLPRTHSILRLGGPNIEVKFQ